MTAGSDRRQTPHAPGVDARRARAGAEMPAWVGWVQAASIAMAVLIVAALVVVAYGVARRAGLAGGSSDAPAAVPAPAALPAVPAFAGPAASLPPGTRILSAEPAAGGLAVLAEDPDGGRTVWIVAPGPDGRTAATAVLEARPR